MTLQDFVSTLERRLSAISSLQQETGISPDLQESRLCDLFQQMLQVADNHLEQTKKERDSTKEAIMSTNLRITKLRRLMGENVSDSGLQTAENNKQALLATLLSAENELALVQKEYDKRLEHVKLLYEELADFADSLTAFVDTDLITYEDIDVSPAAVTALEEEIRRCQNEYDARTRRVYHLGEKISHRRTILQEAAEVDEEIKLMKLISGQLNNEERDVLYRKLVREDRLKQLNFQLKRLDELQNEREFRKQEMVLQLYRLWDRLKVPTEERQEFLKQNAGLRKQDLIAYEQELERLNRLKEEHIEDFIKSAREELESLWNKLYFSQDERLAFKEAFDDNYSEALLDIHDKEIARLQLLLEDRRYILEKVERHMKLMEEIREFEETTNDPSRLFSKGRRDPGRLLREEKFRKRIARELPKANKELEGVLKEFEITEGQPFRVNGQPYIEVVRNTEDTRKPRRPVHLPTETSEASASSKNYVKRMLPNIDDDDVCYNKAMTSPRFRSVGNRQGFRTPQPTRTYDTKALLARRRRLRKADPESTNEPSILHQVREHNIRKRKVNQIAPRGNRTAATTRDSSSSTDHTMDDLFSQDENTVPSESSIDKPIEMPPLKRRSTTERPKHSALTSDDEMALSLNIFDDGPELSDLSADEL